MVWCVSHQGGQDVGEEFGDVVGHLIDAAYDGSEWSCFLVDIGEPIDGWRGRSRVQTIISGVFNDVQFLLVLCHLFVTAGGVPFHWFLDR